MLFQRRHFFVSLLYYQSFSSYQGALSHFSFKRITSVKKDKNSEEKGKDSIVDEKENSQEMVAEKEEREDDEHSREVDVEREMRDDSERDIAYDAVGYSESSNLGVTDKPFMHV